jgi:surfeit locus 1 family protein
VKRFVLGALTLLVVAGLVSLGVWQIERRQWKLALIEQVDRRLAAAPAPAPGPALWPRIARGDAYTRVTVRGSFRNDRETLVQAVTELGPGFWVLAPLVTDRGFTVLVNRGFVPTGRKSSARDTGPVAITGLLRISEPKGGFLRSNDPTAGRWYSRDVGAIAAAKSLGTVAPYFIDADAASGTGWPRGGLTVVAFPNNHLQYALTWFVMAALLAAASLHMALRRKPA